MRYRCPPAFRTRPLLPAIAACVIALCTGPVFAQADLKELVAKHPVKLPEPIQISKGTIRVGNILVATGFTSGTPGVLHEFDNKGTLLSSVKLPAGSVSTHRPHDLVTGSDGCIHLYFGTRNARIASWNPTTGILQPAGSSQLNTSGDTTRGAVAAIGPYVYAISEGALRGIMRLDLRNRLPNTFVNRKATAIDLAAGLNGLLYVLFEDRRTVQVLDPQTMKVITTVSLPPMRAIAVDNQGQIVGSGDDDYLHLFDPAGKPLARSKKMLMGVHDIDIDASGRVVMAIGTKEVGVTLRQFIGRQEPERFKVPPADTLFVSIIQKPAELVDASEDKAAETATTTGSDGAGPGSDPDGASIIPASDNAAEPAGQAEPPASEPTVTKAARRAPANRVATAPAVVPRMSEEAAGYYVAVTGTIGLVLLMLIRNLFNRFRCPAPPISGQVLARLESSGASIPPPLPGGVRATVKLRGREPGKGKRAWTLLLLDDRAVLRNSDDKSVAQFPARELHAAVELPGPGRRHVTLYADEAAIPLYADKKNLAMLKAYVKYSMGNGPRAVRMEDTAQTETYTPQGDSSGKQIVVGLLLIILGLGASGASYREAAKKPGGGTYTVWYGAVIGGLVSLFSGLSGGRRARDDEGPL